MASLTIRNLDDALKRQLRLRGAAHNRSMEEEARQILRAALHAPGVAEQDLATRIRGRFAGMGGVSLVIEPREAPRAAPWFDEAQAAPSRAKPARTAPKAANKVPARAARKVTRPARGKQG